MSVSTEEVDMGTPILLTHCATPRKRPARVRTPQRFQSSASRPPLSKFCFPHPGSSLRLASLALPRGKFPRVRALFSKETYPLSNQNVSVYADIPSATLHGRSGAITMPTPPALYRFMLSLFFSTRKPETPFWSWRTTSIYKPLT